MLNDGSGSFPTGSTVATGTYPRYVAVGDLNKDGTLDLLVSSFGETPSRTDSTVNVHLNDGRGNFTWSQSLAVPGARLPVIGDVNGDGSLDFIVQHENGTKIDVFRNDGQGKFALGQTLVASRVQAASLADTDLDGDQDIVAAIDFGGVIRTYPNVGGTFTVVTGTETPDQVASMPSHLALGDINDDGFVDAVMSTESSTCIAVNDRTGKFPSCVVPVGNNTPGSNVPATLLDIDVDDDLDILVTSDEMLAQNGVSRSGAGFLLLRNSGTGTFNEEYLWTGEPPLWLISTDLDGDCRKDLGYGTSHALRVLSNLGRGIFYSASIAGGWTSNRLGVTDLNADRLPDLVGADGGSFGTGTLYIALNQSGRLDDNAGWGSRSIIGTPSFPVTGYLNSDGFPDVATVNSGDRVSVLLGQGSKAFGEPTHLATCMSPQALQIKDINHDNRNDIIVACAGILGGAAGAGLGVHLGVGDGTFSPFQFYRSSTINRVAVDTLSSDGAFHAIVVGTSGIGVAPISAAGSIGTISWLYPGTYPNLEVVDLDADGSNDLALVDKANSRVVVLWNDGTGAFPRVTLPPTQTPPEDLAAGDLNGDGRLDLAVVQPGAESVRVLLGMENRGFLRHRDYEASTSNSNKTIEILDVDADGQNDVVVGGGGTNRVLYGVHGNAPLNCPTCGDGSVSEPESCDDSNRSSGDGCSSTCQRESGFSCAGQPSACSATCGDTLLRGTEQCDDGNVVDSDGCSGLCSIEAGYACRNSLQLASACAPVCGDGQTVGSEVCDDGNQTDGDSCASTCRHDVWTRSFVTGVARVLMDVATDPSGGAVVVGAFRGTVDFGAGAVTTAGTSAEQFVAQYDPAGKLTWLRRYTGNTYNDINAVTVDAAGSVFFVGSYMDTIDFGSGALPAPSYVGGFLVKLEHSGKLVFSKSFLGAGANSPRDVTVDPSGRIWVTGSTSGSVDFGGGVLSTAGNTDVFISGFDAAGNHLKSALYGDASAQYGRSITSDAAGNIFVAGAYRGAVDFGLGAHQTKAEDGVFLVKFTPEGTPVFSRGYARVNAYDVPSGIATLPSGAVALTGTFQGSLDFGGGAISANGTSGFLALLDTSGAHLWSQSLPVSQVGGVSVDASGSLWLCGAYTGSVSIGETLIPGDANTNLLVAKFTDAGQLIWVSTGSSQEARPVGIAADARGGAYCAGNFYTRLSVGPSAATASGVGMFLSQFAP